MKQQPCQGSLSPEVTAGLLFEAILKPSAHGYRFITESWTIGTLQHRKAVDNHMAGG